MPSKADISTRAGTGSGGRPAPYTAPMFRFSQSSPAIVGHRGAPRVAPENTIQAFRAAADAGASWVELDARRTADGGLVVIHDPVTPDGVPVVSLTLAEAKAAGLEPLVEVLAALPPGLGADIELKNLPGEPDYDDEQRLAALVAEALAPLLGSRPLIASSFHPLALVTLRERLAELPLGLLTVPTLALSSGIDLALEFGADAVFPHVSAPDLSPAVIADAHERGLAVMVWTVDDLHEARRLAEAGADALCTNDPAGLHAAVHGP